jgi:hypothetical protein
MKYRAIAYYCIVVGALMAIQWLFFLATGNVPELETEPLAIAFHLVAELATAIALILAGVGLLRRVRWALPVSLAALGMLLYTVINSAGYFAEQGVWAMVAMFGVLLILTLLAIRGLVAAREQPW